VGGREPTKKEVIAKHLRVPILDRSALS